MPKINQGTVMNTPICYPKDIEVQKNIVRNVEAYFSLVDRLEVQCLKAKQQVDKLAQSVLAKAFRGELVHFDLAVLGKVERVDPFERIPTPNLSEQYRNGNVPIMKMEVAAGPFRSGQLPEWDGWARIETKLKNLNGMFLAKVVGPSMEPTIPEDSYCLFKTTSTGAEQNQVVLVECRECGDAETGGRYIVKRFTKKRQEVRLLSENPSFAPIVLKEDTDSQHRVIAKFLEVL